VECRVYAAVAAAGLERSISLCICGGLVVGVSFESAKCCLQNDCQVVVHVADRTAGTTAVFTRSIPSDVSCT
jgi:hypothetical protein